MDFTDNILSGGVSQRKKFVFFSNILLLVVFTGAALVENNVAVLVVSFGWLLLGSLVINISFPKANRLESQRVWLVFFSIYYAFMVLTKFTYIENPYYDFFFQYDSINFYSALDPVFSQPTSSKTYEETVFVGRNWRGFAVLSWLLNYVAQVFGESNSVLLQMTQTVFVCALTVVFLYNMARIYLPHTQSWGVALSFGLLTHIFTFSGTYTRDTHIMLLFTIGFYIFLSDWRIRNILLLILIGLLAAQFRLQHGLFFVLIVSAYIFLKVKDLENKMAAFFFGSVFLVGFIVLILLNLGAYEQDTIGKLQHYQEYHDEKFEESSGLTATVSRLPSFLQPVANTFISQTYPYPPYRVVEVNNIDGVQYLKFPLGIAQVYWMMVLIVLSYGIFYKKYWRYFPRRLNYAFILAVLLIVAVAMGSYEYRRMLGAYPIIYLVTALIYFAMSKIGRRKLVLRIWAFIIGTFGIYIILKGF